MSRVRQEITMSKRDSHSTQIDYNPQPKTLNLTRDYILQK